MNLSERTIAQLKPNLLERVLGHNTRFEARYDPYYPKQINFCLIQLGTGRIYFSFKIPMHKVSNFLQGSYRFVDEKFEADISIHGKTLDFCLKTSSESNYGRIEYCWDRADKFIKTVQHYIKKDQEIDPN